MYILKGYKGRGLFFGEGNIPVERRELDLPEAAPGTEAKLEMAFSQSELPFHVPIDVYGPLPSRHIR